MNGNFKRIMIIVWSLVIVALIVILGVCINARGPIRNFAPVFHFNGFNFDTCDNCNDEDCTEDKQNYDFDIKDINDFDIDLISADITIKESSDDKVKIETYTNDKTRIKTENESGAIKIQQQGNNVGSWFSFGFHQSSKVILELPKSYNKDFKVKTISGEIVSNMDLNLNKVSIATTSGDTKIRELTCKSINAKSISGELKADKIKGSCELGSTSGDIDVSSLDGSLNANTVSGTVKADFENITGDISVHSVSGDVVFRIPESSGILIDYNATSGDILSDYPYTSQGKHRSTIEIGNKQYHGDISTTSGDFRLTK